MFPFSFVAGFCVSVAGPDELNFKVACLFHYVSLSDDWLSSPMQLIIHYVRCVFLLKTGNSHW